MTQMIRGTMKCLRPRRTPTTAEIASKPASPRRHSTKSLAFHVVMPGIAEELRIVFEHKLAWAKVEQASLKERTVGHNQKFAFIYT